MKKYTLCAILFPKRMSTYRVAMILSGRYVEISLLPLSFAEYAEVKDKSDDAEVKLDDIRMRQWRIIQE